MALAVRDYLPLQQGLRRSYPRQEWISPPVRDYLPLQQGLRLSIAEFFLKRFGQSETIFQYNKD